MRQLILLCALLFASTPAAAESPHEPIPLHILQGLNPDDYPQADLAARHQGIVLYRITVDAEGKQVRCEIIGSSGFKGLDDQTCRSFGQLRFTPAVDTGGRPSFGAFVGRFMWLIPDERKPAAPAWLPYDIELAVSRLPDGAASRLLPVVLVVGADAQVEQCVHHDEPADKALVDIACKYAHAKGVIRSVTDASGHPVRSVQVLVVMFRADAAAGQPKSAAH